MPKIGDFIREKRGYVGKVETLVLRQDLVIVPAPKSDAVNAPDFRILSGTETGCEVGAAWKRTGDMAGDYLAVLLDDPTLLQPIRAHLFKDDDAGTSWSLHWARLKARKEGD